MENMEPNTPATTITERLLAVQQRNNSHLCIGLDLDRRKLPKGISATPEGLLDFGRAIVEATAEFGCCFKPNLAFWSAIGAENHLARLFGFIRETTGMPAILDGKYGDIGNTGEMQVVTAFERFQADAVTVNASLGTDILDPWLNAGLEHLIFALCHTSNPGAAAFQEVIVREEDGTELAMFRRMAKSIMGCEKDGSARLGLVMGATFPKQIGELVDLVPPSTWLLIPALGKQGGDVLETMRWARQFNFVANVSRAIHNASDGADFAQAAAEKARQYRDQINEALAAAA